MAQALAQSIRRRIQEKEIEMIKVGNKLPVIGAFDNEQVATATVTKVGRDWVYVRFEVKSLSGVTRKDGRVRKQIMEAQFGFCQLETNVRYIVCRDAACVKRRLKNILVSKIKIQVARLESAEADSAIDAVLAKARNVLAVLEK